MRDIQSRLQRHAAALLGPAPRPNPTLAQPRRTSAHAPVEPGPSGQRKKRKRSGDVSSESPRQPKKNSSGSEPPAADHTLGIMETVKFAKTPRDAARSSSSGEVFAEPRDVRSLPGTRNPGKDRRAKKAKRKPKAKQPAGAPWADNLADASGTFGSKPHVSVGACANTTGSASASPSSAGGGMPVLPKRTRTTGGQLLEKLKSRLAGGHFRMLNEALYTQTGQHALSMFSLDPGAFRAYHSGYREQVSKWPENPLDCVILWLKKRDPKGGLVVADLGCGEARLAVSVKNKVLSFDLVAANPSVVACNIAHTPLEGMSVDVAVFCLSLMGVDYPDFVAEAIRILKPEGWVLVAEVRSRFETTDPNESTLAAFDACMGQQGLALRDRNSSNKMFIFSVYQKTSKKERGQVEWPELKPCIYKRR